MNDKITQYFDQKRELHRIFLAYIENLGPDDYYENLTQLIKAQNIQENQEELYHLIKLIVNVANNHYRQLGFFNKIERVILFIKDQIKKSMTNFEIYQQFESNKRILLFLIKENILIFDDSISNQIKLKTEVNGIQYSTFFIPEISKLSEDPEKQNELLNQYSSSPEDYEKKREIGENESYICSLIRQDLVEEFIQHISRTNLSISISIKPSIFETNSFLNEREPTLIEYAAFYGSIQIFQYLFLNNVTINGSLWKYAIHSNNPEFLHFQIEVNHIEPEDKSYNECLVESIKCHHNDIASYIEMNLIPETESSTLEERVFEYAFQYSNYLLFKENFDKDYVFFNLCFYDNKSIVELFLEMKKEYIESTIIQTKKIFF